MDDHYRVYMIVYEDHTISPLPNEIFKYIPAERVIYIYDESTLVQIINMRYVKELDLTPPIPTAPTPPENEPEEVGDLPVLLSQMCTCDNEPDPSCPFHRKRN